MHEVGTEEDNVHEFVLGEESYCQTGLQPSLKTAIQKKLQSYWRKTSVKNTICMVKSGLTKNLLLRKKTHPRCYQFYTQVICD